MPVNWILSMYKDFGLVEVFACICVSAVKRDLRLVYVADRCRPAGSC